MPETRRLTTWVKWIGGCVSVLVAAAGITAGYGSWRWQRLTDALVMRLEATRETPRTTRIDLRETAGLPPVVQRYFRAALTDGAPIVAAATVEHTGTMNMSDTAESWVSFRSTQRVVTRRPGFVWDARVRMMPGIDVRVHDAYVAGEGILHPALLGVLSLGDARGTGDALAHGELMRFFAETAWYPTALLPSQGVRWDAVDDHSALAVLVDGSLTTSLTFSFGADGLIDRVRADARGRTVGTTTIPTPWEGRWSNVQTRDGLLVPLDAEVAWLLPEGRMPYWRGTITSLTYEFVP